MLFYFTGCYAVYFRFLSVLNDTIGIYGILLTQSQPELNFINHTSEYKGVVREITAYNAGVSAQTDSEPCISADNTNICQALARGELICACNFVPLGTQLYIKEYGTCVVRDRMNKRYKNRVDIAFPADQIQEALQFGKRNLIVKILN